MTAARRPHSARVLGVDVGGVRIGLAASDETRTLASPLVTLRRDARDLWDRLRAELANRGAATVVVGLPRRLDGTEGDAAEDARRFAAELERETSAAVEFWDERFTTALAERHLISGGMRRTRRRRTIDAVAAAVLLQSWLDAHAGDS